MNYSNFITSLSIQQFIIYSWRPLDMGKNQSALLVQTSGQAYLARSSQEDILHVLAAKLGVERVKI
jgi:hypothetical protein